MVSAVVSISPNEKYRENFVLEFADIYLQSGKSAGKGGAACPYDAEQGTYRIMIRLQRIEIQNFGKLRQVSYDFDGQVQVFYGVNEAGKTTLQRFLKTMLYGVSKRGGRDEVKERERILPWNGGTAGGSLYLQKDGQELMITRAFGQRPSADEIRVFDRRTGGRLPEFEVDNCGEVLLGMTEPVFLKTLCVRQQDIPIRGREEDLQKKLLHLMTDGAGTISFSAAQRRLAEEHKRLKAESGREKPGIIDRNNEELLSLRREIYRTETMNKQRQQSRERLSAQKRALEEAELHSRELAEKQRAADAARVVAAKACVEECRGRIQEILSVPEMQMFKETKPEEMETLSALENEILALDRKAGIGYDREEAANNNYARIAGWIAGGAMLFAALMGFVLGKPLFGAVFGSFAAGAFVLAGIWRRRKGNTVQYPEFSQEAAYKELVRQRDEQLKKWQASDVSEVRTAYQTFLQLGKEMEMLQSICRTELGSRTFSDLLAQAEELEPFCVPDISAAEHFEAEIIRQNERCQELRQAVKAAEQEMGYEVYHDRDAGLLAGRAAQIEKEQARLLQRYRAVCLAEDKMRTVYQRFQSDFTPVLLDKVRPLLEQMTDGAYTDVRIADDFRVRFCRDGVFRQSESLSCGTYDRIYLAVRLALASVIAGRSFLCMDDVLTNSDDRHAESAAETICAYAKREGQQILLFTCHRRDAENFRKFQASVTEI